MSDRANVIEFMVSALVVKPRGVNRAIDNYDTKDSGVVENVSVYTSRVFEERNLAKSICVCEKVGVVRMQF